ncbi:MAG: ABC transporter permease [Solirubrobacterales bacterium]|nr:ABC transporter permease [Solirubrobacterales bacterium]
MSTPDSTAIRPLAAIYTGSRRQLIGRAVAGVLIAFFIFGAVTTDSFTSIQNIRAILVATGFVGIVAVGMTVIMLSGNLFSLSLGTTVSVGAITFLWALKLGLVPAILITLGVGTAACAVQGLVIGAIGANPIIVTIGAGALQAGVAAWLTDGSSIFPPAGDKSFDFMTSTPLGIAFPVYVLVVLVIICELVMRRTRFGKEVYLVGENRQAATAAGLRVTLIITGAFAIAGACAALAGMLLGAFNQNATLLVGGTFTFDAIAAALVGGSAVTGGRGSVTRALFGALIIAAISDMLLLRGYSTGIQIMVKGLLVLFVVVIVQLNAREDRA